VLSPQKKSKAKAKQKQSKSKRKAKQTQAKAKLEGRLEEPPTNTKSLSKAMCSGVSMMISVLISALNT
jgi:hypothetical protein